MLSGKKYIDAEGRTVAVYPSPILAWSQDVNVGSHLGSSAFDETVDGTATKKPIYNPGNMIVVAKEAAGKSNAVILDTLNPEHWADGTIDFYHLRLVHDDDISDIALNQVFHQGDKLYDEGVYGKVTGPHIHIEVGRGKYPGRLVLNHAGNYALINSVEPWKVFFVNDTTIMAGFGHPWKTYVAPVVPVLKFKVGQTVVLNGQVFRNSLLAFPGNSYSGKKVTVEFTAPGAPAPYHVSGIGWVKESALSAYVAPAPAPIVVKPWDIGNVVRINLSAAKYVTGQKIPLTYKGLRKYTVQELYPSANPNRALLKEIMSWVYLSDVKKV